jgi:hypothetical protein
VLPRIRRSPCETDSAAMKRGCKGTVALMAGARPSETRVGWRPFVPLTLDGGAVGGARWDDWRTGCHLPTVGAATRPMCQLAWRSGCSAADRTITSGGGSAADAPPRKPKASDWRGGRAAASTSMDPVFSGPAPGLAGDRGGVRDARAPSAATCERGPIAKRASVMRSMTYEGARDLRARERAAACLSRLRRPDRVASGMEPVRGETPVLRWLDAQRDSPAPRQRGDAQAQRDLASTTPP